jgi:hypothetical protein
MSVRVATAAALVLALGPVFGAQAPADDPMWLRLSNAVSRVRAVEAGSEPRLALERYATVMSRDIAVMKEALDRRGRPIADPFRKSVDLDSEALERITDGKPSIQRVVFVVGGVAEDLSVKARAVFENDSKGGVQVVDVSAWTSDGQVVRHGKEVWYTPWAYRDGPSKDDRFPTNSSPSVKPLSSGKYEMWSAEPGGHPRGARTPVEVGPNGQTTWKVDLPVPQAAPRP